MQTIMITGVKRGVSENNVTAYVIDVK